MGEMVAAVTAIKMYCINYEKSSSKTYNQLCNSCV